MVDSPSILLPGEQLAALDLPTPKKNGALTIGPGLKHTPPMIITATTSGTLHIDHKKAAVCLEHSHGRYLPAPGDLVVAQIHRMSGESWQCIITPATQTALLHHLNFEATSKKVRPNLKTGDLVYARVARCQRDEDVELECVDPATHKANGMGPLKGGMVFGVSPSFARRMMMGTDRGGVSKGHVVVLEEAGQKVRFEVAVGRNGRVWIDSGSLKATMVIGRLLTNCDEEGWDVQRQRKEVRKALKEIAG